MLIERLERVALSGGSAWVLYLMIFLSLLSIGIMIDRLVFFAKHGGDATKLGDRLVDKLREGDREGAEKLLQESKLIEAAVLKRALPWVDGGPESLSEALEAEMNRKRKQLEQGMTFLGTLGNNAPFIGLLGTVLGVIQAFHQLGDGGAGQNKAAMGNVMTGIAEALIATGVGLVVAIPAVVAFNVAQKKIGEIESNVTSIGKQLLALLKFSPRERSGKAAFQASDEAEKIAADERAAEGHGRAAEREDAFPASPANGAHHSPNGAVSAMEA